MLDNSRMLEGSFTDSEEHTYSRNALVLAKNHILLREVFFMKFPAARVI